MFAMDKRPDDEEDGDDYPDRRFSFAPTPAARPRPSIEEKDEMSDLKAQLK